MHPVFMEIHSGLPREAPGSFETTKRAFDLIEDKLQKNSRFLDIGCGPGMQTMDLANLISSKDGSVCAVDIHQPYLDRLSETCQKSGLSDRVSVKCADMCDLSSLSALEGSGGEKFNVIWSEGAIYIIGFDHGLDQWKRLLKPGGFLAVTELTWLKSNPPEPIETFWKDGYPAMRTIDQNLEALTKAGYNIIDSFALPESAWWENYYNPMEKRISELAQKYKNTNNNSEALQVLTMERQEIDLYRRYSEYYGYVFYIAQLPN